MPSTAKQQRIVRRTVAQKPFATLATSSASHWTLVAGVLYVEGDGALYVTTSRSSAKVRHIRENPRVAVCIPVQSYPLFPPFCVQFQGHAMLHAPDDPAIAPMLASGRLKKITSHGELDDPNTCLVRIPLPRRVATYGLGVPIRTLLRDPLAAARVVELA